MGFGQTGIRPDEFRPNEAGPVESWKKRLGSLSFKIRHEFLNAKLINFSNCNNESEQVQNWNKRKTGKLDLWEYFCWRWIMQINFAKCCLVEHILIVVNLPLFSRYRWCFFTRLPDAISVISCIETIPWAGHMASGQDTS
jgi:hypothetical protein